MPRAGKGQAAKYPMYNKGENAERARRSLPILVRQVKAGQGINYGQSLNELGMYLSLQRCSAGVCPRGTNAHAHTQICALEIRIKAQRGVPHGS